MSFCKKSCNNGYHHKFPIFNDISHYFIETFRARFIKIFVQNDETFGFLWNYNYYKWIYTQSHVIIQNLLKIIVISHTKCWLEIYRWNTWKLYYSLEFLELSTCLWVFGKKANEQTSSFRRHVSLNFWLLEIE